MEHHKQVLEQKSSISSFYVSPNLISNSCLEVLQKYFMKISISPDCDLEIDSPVFFVDSVKSTVMNINLIQKLSSSTDVKEVASLKELQRNLSIEGFKDLEIIKGVKFKSVGGKLVLCAPGFVVQNIIADIHRENHAPARMIYNILVGLLFHPDLKLLTEAVTAQCITCKFGQRARAQKFIRGVRTSYARPFEHLSVDIAHCRGKVYDYVMVVIDRFSHFTLLFSLKSVTEEM